MGIEVNLNQAGSDSFRAQHVAEVLIVEAALAKVHLRIRVRHTFTRALRGS